MTLRGAHPANVPGDFYVEAGCCTRCDVPFTIAPDLFGIAGDPDSYDQCYVKQQPTDATQLGQMLETIQCAELGCIRYRGTDRSIQLRIAQMGEGNVCDGLPDDLRAISDQARSDLLTARPSWLWRLFCPLKSKWVRWRYRRADPT